MLKLTLVIEDKILRVRKPTAKDLLSQKFIWREEIEFYYSDSPLLTVSWNTFLPELSPSEARSFVSLVGARYPFSQDYGELKELCPQLLFQDEADEWVFFGGSFNPWHAGHQACLDLMPEDKTCFIIPDKNPLKELLPQDPIVDLIKMVNEIKFKSKHYLAPGFILLNKKNPTVEWIKGLRQHFPDQKLSLLMGFDSFANLEKWKEYQTLLLNLSKIYVVSRLELDDSHVEALSVISKVRSDLEVEFLGRHEFEKISSTEIRKGRP